MTQTLQRALAGLNPQQREAVLHFDSPLLILAGAGSGKTRVITVKVAYLIEKLGISPHSILAVTFTNKAAGEMRERAMALTPDAADTTIRTFHSFGAWLLRRNADAIGLTRNFTIYDDDDSVTLLRSLYPQFNRNVCALLARQISRAKDYCLTPDDDLSEVSDDPEFHKVYRSYQNRLDEIGNVDFGDLIMKTVSMVEDNTAVSDRVRSRFRYILVDEYQDSNVAQYRLLRALADDETFIAVVGDDDQSIYRFRGAEVRNILTFSSIFAGTQVVRLEENYRSTAPILDIAGSVVSRNEGRLGKSLFTRRAGGLLPEVAFLSDQDEEIDYVVDQVKDGLRRGKETAILYRTNAQSRGFETAFLRLQIPYRIIGSLRFYDREEIKDAVAFLKFYVNPRDEVGFRRIVNKPTRGIGEKSIEKILTEAGTTNRDIVAAAKNISTDKGGLSRKAGAALSEFLEVLQEEFDPTDEAHLGRFVETILSRSGLWNYHREQDRVAGTQKVQNMEELINAASLYPASVDGLIDFLEAVELDSARERQDDENARVVLITMHNTKGLEFDRVIVTGLEDGLFPRDHEPDELEEERRLFYVAITRAKDELYMTSCGFRRIHGRPMQMVPSVFLSEVPEKLYRVHGSAAENTRRVESAGEVLEWPRGTAVYHDEYGGGIIIKSWYSGSEPCVMVRFQTGRTAQFLTKYATLDRVAEDFA